MFNNDDFTYFDYTIWGKLFKTDVYKKTVNLLTYERYSKFVTYTEDIIGLFVVCNVAESYKFIRKYGVFHKDYVASTSYTAPNELRIFADTFFSEIIFDFARNEYKKLSAVFFVKRSFLSSEVNNKYLLKVIHKIMSCEYIEEKYKEMIRVKFGDFIK
jgi:hypothetical protein